MAQGEAVGNTTLGDLTIGALERLFNALPRCPRACVVVTNLKDDVYLDGSGQLRTLVENLTKHYDRNAQAITRVQQNTGEVFAFVRKRLFDALRTGLGIRVTRWALMSQSTSFPEGTSFRSFESHSNSILVRRIALRCQPNALGWRRCTRGSSETSPSGPPIKTQELTCKGPGAGSIRKEIERRDT
jgi:hypothetical protein